MGIGDSMRDLAGKAKDKISPDQANEGLDQVEDRANEATGGRYESQLDKGREVAGEQVDRRFGDDQTDERGDVQH